MKNRLDLLLGLAALVTVIYRAFQLETAIYNAIDHLKDLLTDRINSLERSLGLHIAIYSERKEQVDYLLHALDEKIDHKSNRFIEEIKDIKYAQRNQRGSEEE